MTEYSYDISDERGFFGGFHSVAKPTKNARPDSRAISIDVPREGIVVKLYTIGFTQTTAQNFFSKLRGAGVVRILDTRLHRDGQLSGFAKIPDLPYFLERLADSAYFAMPSLAPTKAMLKAYREKLLSWEQYAESYGQLLTERKPERDIDLTHLHNACLLCSELTPATCHRRLAAEYLRETLSGRTELQVIHL